jgi:hypothetical protein
MPKTTIEFSQEENHELEMCVNGWRYYSVIWDMQQFLRNEMKHGDLSDIQYVCYEKIRTKLFELIEDHKAVIE